MRTRRSWSFVACALLLSPLLAVVIQGCGENAAVEVLCPRRDGTGTYDPWCDVCAVDLTIKGCNRCVTDTALGPSFACYKDAGTDSAIIDGGATGCAGDCLPVPPAGWFGPDLLWIGPAGTAPSCPDTAPVVAHEGHADPVAPPPASCTACTCSASSGTCAPPLHFSTSSAVCAANAPAVRFFDPPPSWDGSCTSHNPIAAGELCNGVPCAVSLTAAPLVLTESGCTPGAAVLTNVMPATWSTAVLACSGVYPADACHDHALTCGPSAAWAPGFVSCIFQHGDNDCPPSYPDKHVTYSGSVDHRDCAPCTCGASDGACKGVLQVYKDDACTSKPALLTLDLTSAEPKCENLPPPDLGLGSKEVIVTYSPGACTPGGGEMRGGLEVLGASTFCCLASA